MLFRCISLKICAICQPRHFFIDKSLPFISHILLPIKYEASKPCCN
jgi:hypothetical protein